ncbi:MAG: hypothetical protein L0Y36_09605, partial [Planctomycetales bacterium]|nr:hypothetical protein [Planctomycetales bacterium]
MSAAKSILLTVWLCAVFFTLTGTPAAETATQNEGWYRVANEDCGSENSMRLMEGSVWRYPEDAIPADKVSPDDPARTIVFGSNVVYRFEGLNPSAQYRLEIICLSDDGGRAQKLLAGGKVLHETIHLPQNNPLTV